MHAEKLKYAHVQNVLPILYLAKRLILSDRER